jgi:hypothetical protein
LFYSGIEGVAVNVHNVLGEIARKLMLSEQVVGCPELAREVKRLKVALLN